MMTAPRPGSDSQAPNSQAPAAPQSPAAVAARALSSEGLEFLGEYHLAMLTTINPDGTPHVSAVGFTYVADADGGATVRIITSRGSQKVRNIERNGIAAVGQVDGARWLSFRGSAIINHDPAAIAEAVRLYGARYRVPRPNPERIAVELSVERSLGSKSLFLD